MSFATAMRSIMNGLESDYSGSYGVIYGLEFPKPASGLTVTYTGGTARLAPDNTTISGNRFGRRFRIAGSTKAFTASKDTYVYLDSAGVLSYSEQTTGAAKPTLASLSAPLGQYLWLVTTDGSNVTAVYWLGQRAAAWLEELSSVQMSFVTATQGATGWMKAPYAFRLISLDGVVAAALGATDTGTITAARVAAGTAANIANAVLTFAISAAVGVIGDAVPTIATNPVFEPNDVLRLTSAKTTTGGAVNVRAIVERLA